MRAAAIAGSGRRSGAARGSRPRAERSAPGRRPRPHDGVPRQARQGMPERCRSVRVRRRRRSRRARPRRVSMPRAARRRLCRGRTAARSRASGASGFPRRPAVAGGPAGRARRRAVGLAGVADAVPGRGPAGLREVAAHPPAWVPMWRSRCERSPRSVDGQAAVICLPHQRRPFAPPRTLRGGGIGVAPAQVAVQLTNVRWLSRYRYPRCVRRPPAERLREVFAQPGPLLPGATARWPTLRQGGSPDSHPGCASASSRESTPTSGARPDTFKRALTDAGAAHDRYGRGPRQAHPARGRRPLHIPLRGRH